MKMVEYKFRVSVECTDIKEIEIKITKSGEGVVRLNIDGDCVIFFHPDKTASFYLKALEEKGFKVVTDKDGI